MSPGAPMNARRLAATATLVTLALGVAWVPAARADAQAGDLDSSFGGDGIVTTAFTSFGGAFATDIAFRDGQIAVVGGDGGGRFALGLYTVDGSLAFDRVTTNLGGSDRANGVAITSGRGIVSAGSTTPSGGEPRFALARYFATGDLNHTFGDGGKVVTAINLEAVAHDVALQPDGKIVAAGRILNENFGRDTLDFALARYNPDGSLDSSFDGNGIRVTGFGGEFDDAVARTVAIQPNGKIVSAGFHDALNGREPRFALALTRHHTDGKLDTSFDGDGKVITTFGSVDASAQSVAIQADGKIVVAGRAGDKLALARYLPDGSLDPSFGSGGRVAISVGSGADRADAVAIQPDGKIVAAGRTAQGGGNVALVRLLPNGVLDSSFGDAGRVITGIGGDESANGIAIQDDGRILIAGKTSTGDGRFLLARYHAEAIDDTPPDTTISGPSGAISDPEPSFELASTEPGSTFECELDGAGFEPCSSPHAVGPLADGDHRLRARATDEAGLTDPTPDSRSFTVDTTVAIQIKGTKLPLRKRRLAARLACPGDEASGPCRGRIVVKTRGKVRFEGKLRRVKLASARYSIEAGETSRLRASLGKKPLRVKRIIRLLRNKPLARRAKTIARVRDGAGNRARVVKKQRITIR